MRQHLRLLALLGCSAPTTTFLQAQLPAAASSYADKPLVFERFHQHYRYEADGTSRAELHVRVRIQSEAALEALGQLALPYGSSNQRLSVDSVRVHNAGGSVLAPASAVQDLTASLASEAPMYSDLRMKVVTVPGLRVGDTLEYHVTWVTHTPLARDNFWFAYSFNRYAIVLDEALVVDVPRAAYVQVRTSGAPQPAAQDSGARRVYTWHSSTLAMDTTERGLRAARNAPRNVQLTTFRSWDDVGRWYAALEHDRERVTPAIHAVADSLVRGRTTRRDSIAAIYDFVSLNFRYVSLSFGLGRYQPHEAGEVLANAYGDCKDKHTLMAALLRAIGVASAPVLINSDTPIDSTVPSPQQFDHLITFVPLVADTLWLDATPETAPFRHLLLGLRNRQALVMPIEGTARLVRTPAASPFPEVSSVSVDAHLSDAGRLSAMVRHRFRGDAEVFIRAVLRRLSADQRAAMAAQMARADAFGGTASAFESADPRATREPAQFSFQVEQPGALSWRGPRAQLAMPLPPMDMADAPDSAAPPDTLELAVGEEARQLTLELPPGVHATLPTGVILTRDFAEYRSTYRIDGRTLSVTRDLHVREDHVPPEQIAQYAALRQAIRDDEQQVTTLARDGPPPVAEPATAPTGNAEDANRVGQDLFAGRDFRGAVRAFQRAVALDPRHPTAWRRLGLSYDYLFLYDSAATAFQRHLALNPDDPAILDNLGFALRNANRFDEATAVFRRQLESRPLDPYAHSSLGIIALTVHRDSEAVAELERAASLASRDPVNHFTLARAYLAVRDSDRAVAAFDRAMDLDSSPGLRNSAAYTLALSGMALDRAASMARSAIDTASKLLAHLTLDGYDARAWAGLQGLGAYWDTYGWILFRKGDVAGAEPWVRAAWLLNYHGEVGDHLGQILERTGRRTDALKTYAMALAAMAPPADVRTHLVALAGGRAEADRLAEAGRAEFQRLRTIRLGSAPRASGAGEAMVLIGPGSRVEDVRVITGPDALHRAEGALKAAAFPGVIPDTTTVRIVRRGLLTCGGAAGVCTFVIFESQSPPGQNGR